MQKCSICLQVRERLKFKTGRMSICSYCVTTLNNTELSASEAKEKWKKSFRESVIRNRPDSVEWVDRWLNTSEKWILAQKLTDQECVKKSHELKVLRAYKSGIICWNREYLDYPKNWEFKRFRTKHLDKYACNVCGAREENDIKLHVHHIVFRSRSGTNSYRNLVTLCFKHHQSQHDHEISLAGGEPRGKDIDHSIEETDALWGEKIAEKLPEEFSEKAYIEARPTFEAARDAFVANNKTAQELFVFLIQAFGRNVGKYALRFAREEKFHGAWFKNERSK